MNRKNAQGGWTYETESENRRAKVVDLITLPRDTEGTNCGNCRFIDAGKCTHPDVRLPVTPRMCCARWDRKGVLRSWIARIRERMEKMI